MRALLILCLALWPGVSPADDRAAALRIEAAVAAWLAETPARSTALAVTYRGRIVHLGGNHPGRRFELASLGKAITAACVGALVREGRIGFDDTLGGLLGAQIPPVLRGISIAELLTHSAGLWPDSTQKDMPRWLGSPGARHGDVLARVIARGRRGGMPGKFRYNNENYALLGEVIARAAGEPYRTACADRVLTGLLSARVSPRMGAYDAWGGWQMTVADYARFHARTFASAPAPQNLPHVPAYGPGIFYGMGTNWRAFGAGHNFWHLGLLCMGGGEAGAYAVLWSNGWGVTLAWDACVPWEAFIDLDTALARAVFQP